MRVGFLTSSYPKGIDDPLGSHIHHLARSIRAVGVGVEVATVGRRDHAYVLDGIHVSVHGYGIGAKRGSLSHQMGGILPALRRHPATALQVPGLVYSLRSGARLLAQRTDLIHAHWMLPAGLTAVCPRPLTPVLVTVHGSDAALAMNSRIAGRLSKIVVSNADAVTCVSQHLLDLVGKLGARSDRSFLTSLGVDPIDQIAEERPFRFVYVGALTKNKSVGTLLDAVARLSSTSEFQVWIVGDGPERVELEKSARLLNVRSVEFRGSLAHEDALQTIARSDCLVLPSLFEGRGMVILEAMAAGLPVLATRVGGIVESVAEGKTGHLFEPSDAGHLAQLMKRFIDNPRYARRLGAEGRRMVDELQLTSTDSAMRFHDLYRQLLVI